MRPVHALVVAAGGSAGSAARWAVATAVGAAAIPWALLIINTIGSLGLGLVVFGETEGNSKLLRLGVGVGFCGGLTTFSSFALAAVDLGRDGELPLAGSFVAMSVITALAAVMVGAWTASLMRSRR